MQIKHNYQYIISFENLLGAWQEFKVGKRFRADVQEFEFRLMSHISMLHYDLAAKTYIHGGYRHFAIADPKRRDIHKTSVRDRLVHHALHRVLYPFFDQKFIPDSYSCRVGKGTHKALNRFCSFVYIVSKNNTRACWALKCDIRKFFANIDHGVLMAILGRYISDADILNLLRGIIESFYTSDKSGIGLPLGNLTSQLFVNIYMNEFDQFIKHALKEKYYVRYADDFIVLSDSKPHLETLVPKIAEFLRMRLRLELHPDKLFLKTVTSGVDFLGWVHFPDHRILRTTTKKRIIRRIAGEASNAVIASYRGFLTHGNARKLERLYLK